MNSEEENSFKTFVPITSKNSASVQRPFWFTSVLVTPRNYFFDRQECVAVLYYYYELHQHACEQQGKNVILCRYGLLTFGTGTVVCNIPHIHVLEVHL